jgi:hypothetical protein
MGLKSATEKACCDACKSDPSCTAFVFGHGSKSGKDCWPLKGYTSTEPVADRTLVLVSSKKPSTFSRTELSITISADSDSGFSGATWRPGDVDKQNLGGTISSWNEVDPVDLGSKMPQGILSRSGWALVDDTSTHLFASSNETDPPLFAGAAPWNKHEPINRTAADWYFFGCGLHYKECLAEWVAISGPIAMPPRY